MFNSQIAITIMSASIAHPTTIISGIMTAGLPAIITKNTMISKTGYRTT
jgi:hypothetical protein